MYSWEIIENIKLRNTFINTVNETKFTKFRSDIVIHKKVFHEHFVDMK